MVFRHTDNGGTTIQAANLGDLIGGVATQVIGGGIAAVISLMLTLLYVPQGYRGYTWVFMGSTVGYYCGSRFYMPELGRFLNADAYTDTGTGVVGTNMFAYCNNNPVMFVDPEGKDATTVFDEQPTSIAEEIIILLYVVLIILGVIPTADNTKSIPTINTKTKATAAEKADAEIRSKLKNKDNAQYYCAVKASENGFSYVKITKKISKSNAIKRVQNCNNVFVNKMKYAEELALIFCYGPVNVCFEKHDGNGYYYYHYHTYLRNGSHIWFSYF